jgi:hypothetical protein
MENSAMTKRTMLLGMMVLNFSPALNGQDLNGAEVRLPYAELKQLLARSEEKVVTKPEEPRKPALLSARLNLTLENGSPVIEGQFRTTSFSPDFSYLPLWSGDLSLESQDPEDATLVAEQGALCLASDRSGMRTLKLRMIPVQRKKEFTFSIPPCPSVMFETGNLSQDESVQLVYEDKEEILAANQLRALPNTGATLRIRILDASATREALSPPKPSTWTWQHQALVSPSEASLDYQVIARASSGVGSGVEAQLALPPDAQEISVAGEDLLSFQKTRGDDGSLGLTLSWKTRGILDRQLIISYQVPLRPLDRKWQLQAPSGKVTRTRFIIASSPLMNYAAEGLSAPLAPVGLPDALAKLLKGNTSQHLETEFRAELSVQPIPVAATAEGVINEAKWSLKMESDGAMLLTGSLNLQHKKPMPVIFDMPEGLRLLACEIDGRSISPADLGEGLYQVTFAAQNDRSCLTLSFTGTRPALDPVEGTLQLSLPKIPLFIHALNWQLDLPAGYQAETHGNLKRLAIPAANNACRISLQKNLCRDERPEVQVFYQRSNLNR